MSERETEAATRSGEGERASGGEPVSSAPSAVPAKKKTGFALLTPERRKEIARKGGRVAHEQGSAHRFDSESARKAGLLSVSSENRHRWTSETAREAGSLGGRSAAARARMKKGEST